MSAGEDLASQTQSLEWPSLPPFYEHLGLKLEALGGGKCVCALPYAKHFGNSRGEVHGGIVASVLDIAMSQAARSAIPELTNIATISMTVSYLAPAHGVLTCNAVLVKAGGAVAFAEGEVSDAKGTPVCRATATYRIRRGR